MQHNYYYSKNKGGEFLINQEIKSNNYNYQLFVKFILKIYAFVGW